MILCRKCKIRPCKPTKLRSGHYRCSFCCNREPSAIRYRTTKKWHEANLKRGQRYRHTERGRYKERAKVTIRRMRVISSAGNLTPGAWLQKVVYHGWRCAYCTIPLTVDTITIDHRIPVSKGGTNWLSNLVPSCKMCNCLKGATVK